MGKSKIRYSSNAISKNLLNDNWSKSLTQEQFLLRAEKQKGFWWNYWPHTKPLNNSKWIKRKIRKGSLIICSIDPGVLHLGIRIEKKCKLGTSFLHYELKQFKNDRKDKNRDKSTFVQIMSYIKSLENILLMCDLVIIEKQLGLNRDAEPIMFGILSYCITLLKDNYLQTMVVLVSSKLKSLVFCDLTGLKSKQLKLATVKIAKRIMKRRKENSSLKVIKEAEKKAKADDISDPIVMIEAFLLVSWVGVILLSREFTYKDEETP